MDMSGNSSVAGRFYRPDTPEQACNGQDALKSVSRNLVGLRKTAVHLNPSSTPDVSSASELTSILFFCPHGVWYKFNELDGTEGLADLSVLTSEFGH